MTDERKIEEHEKYGKHYIGNVIRIIDTRNVIVNVGKNTLSVGDSVQIYAIGDEIKDIDDSFLANYEFIKETLEVTQVSEVYSVCSKIKTRPKTNSSQMNTLTKYLSVVTEISSVSKEYIPLNIDENDILPLKEYDSTVRIGDPIKLS